METTTTHGELMSPKGDPILVDSFAGPLGCSVTFAPGERWREITVSIRGMERTFMVERVESLPGSGEVDLWDAKVRAVRVGPSWIPQ